MESLWVWRLGLSSQFINLISKIDPHSKNCLPIVEILVLAIPLMKVSGCVANSDPEINKLINFISKKVFLHQCHSYFLLKTEQKPDKYGYVTPRERSNQPVTMDVVLFNRSASSASEVRARQLADAERKSRSLPGGMYFKDKSWKIYCDDHSSLSKISLSRSKFSSWCTVTIQVDFLQSVKWWLADTIHTQFEIVITLSHMLFKVHVIGILSFLPFWHLSGVSQVDILEQAIRQSVISGKISDKEASQFLQKLDNIILVTLI